MNSNSMHETTERMFSLTLYALKCSNGYLKIINQETYECVDMDKASVYPKEKLESLKEHLNRTKNKGLNKVRIVELTVIENEDFYL